MTSATQIHVSLRTYAMPSLICGISASCAPSSEVLRECIRKMETADPANVRPSKMNAQPVPIESNNPPSKGPTIVMAKGRTTCPTEFASTRTSSGTIEGTIEENAGPNSA